MIGEYNADGIPQVEYVWMDDKPVAAIYGSGTATKIYWIASDVQNTPRRLINAADATTTVWAWDSTTFGVGLPSVQTVKFNLRFPGQYYDELTKQHYNHNRFYNPALGRYVEPDRIGLEGGLNPYIYANGNPVSNIDPSGLYAYINAKNEWVENGQSFYSISGGAFTDKLSYNFASDVATLAPLPKFSWLSKFDDLLFKSEYDNVIDMSATTLATNEKLSKSWILSRPKLATPPLPPSIANQNILGSKVLQWGKGAEGAALRTQNITKFEVATIQAKGFSEPMARQWRTFYANEFLRNVNNTTARNRVQLIMGEIK